MKDKEPLTSPLPWVVAKSGVICSQDSNVVQPCPQMTDRDARHDAANLAFIVKAVNSHASLVAVRDAAIALLEASEAVAKDDSTRNQVALDEADIALRRALAAARQGQTK